jgi:hypothetical protein
MKPFSEHMDPLFGDSGCLSVDAIQRYLANSLSNEERLLIAEHLRSCALCRDAMEGFQQADLAGDQIREITTGLNRRLRENYADAGREERPGEVRFRSRRPLLMAAASVVLLAGMATLLYFFFSLPQQTTIPANENNGLAAAGEVKKEETGMTSGPVTEDTGKERLTNGITLAGSEETQSDKSELPAGETIAGSRPEAADAKEGLTRLMNEVAETDPQPQASEMSSASIPETQIITGETPEYLQQADHDQTVSAVRDLALDKEAEMKAGETNFAAKRSSGKSYAEGLMVQPLHEAEPAVPADKYDDPVFPGGPDSLHAYFMRNFVMPAEAAMAENDSICVAFIVGPDGSPGSIQVFHGEGKGMDTEIIRLMEGMPAWVPASSGEKTVAAAQWLVLEFSKNKLLSVVNGNCSDVLQP